MKLHLRSSIAGLAPLAFGAILTFVAPAHAQSASPLPTVPGAERAAEGGLTQAHASLPGEPGKSPLEPYLVTWLLPVSGLLTVFAGVYVDRRMRALDPRRKLR